MGAVGNSLNNIRLVVKALRTFPNDSKKGASKKNVSTWKQASQYGASSQPGVLPLIKKVILGLAIFSFHSIVSSSLAVEILTFQMPKPEHSWGKALAGSLSVHKPLEGILQNESLVSSCVRTSCLYYNPARLAFENWNLNIVGAGISVDENSSDLSWQAYNSEDPESMILENLGAYQGKRKALRADLNVFQLSIPYFAFDSFSSISLENLPKDGEEQFSLESKIGLSAGVAFSVGKMSLGVSGVRIQKTRADLNPSDAQITEISDLVEQDRTGEIALSEFTSLEQGYGHGMNLGFFYGFDEEGGSGIGISALNYGGLSYRKNTDVEWEELSKSEKALSQFAENAQISVNLPNDVPEVLNAGLTLGNHPDHSIYHFMINAERQDIGGNYLEHKNVVSARLGIDLPPEVALKLSQEFLNSEGGGNGMHLGFKGFQFFGGYRPEKSRSFGGKLSLHGGYKKVISLLQIDVVAGETTEFSERDDEGIVLKDALTTKLFRLDFKLNLLF